MNSDAGRTSYLQRWRRLSRPARLYLLHAALLTSSLAISGLFFNLAIVALGYPLRFLGILNTVSIAVAALLSLPLWWLAARIGLRRALLASAAFQAASALLFALWPAAAPLLFASSLTGVAAVLFQVSAPPFMMRHSDATERDHLFSANAAINIGLAGVGSLVAGGLPGLFGRLLGVSAESATAYRTTFAVAAAGLALSLVPLLFIADEGRPTADRRPPTADRRPPTADRRRTKNEGPPAETRRHGDTETRRQETRDERQETRDERQETGDSTQYAIRNTQYASDIRHHALRFTFYVLRFTPHAILDRIPEPWRGMVRRPWPLIWLLIPPFLISWGAALLIPYLNLFFKERFVVGDSLLGLIFAGLNIATGAAALAGPALSTRIGKIRTVALTQALSIPFLLALGFVPLLGVAVGAALARAALFNMGTPLYDAFAMERTEEAARPTVIGLINGAYSAGYLVAPAISTLVQERYGFTPLFVATAICYALAVLANYWFFVRGGRAVAVREREEAESVSV